jgi:hypothetical protein
MVSGGGDVEADSFFMAGSSKDEGTVVGDVAIFRRATVGKDKGYRLGFS